MGLDDFKTESSSSSSSGSTSNNGPAGVTTVRDSDVRGGSSDEIRPWFTAAIEREDEVVRTYIGKRAFDKTSRFKNEKFLVSIETEDRYEDIRSRCEELHDCNLEELFKSDPIKAKDFVSRLNPQSNDDELVTCEICGETFSIMEENYTKVNGKIVHAHHRVDEVAEQLGIGE